jgi:hypothetical protein
MRSRQVVLRDRAEIHQKLNYELLDCLLRVFNTTELLRPIAEGMAQFAEFDCAPPSGARIMTPVHDAMVDCFFEGAPEVDFPEGSAGACLAAAMVIGRARLSDRVISRKASLFLRPLDCRADPYLTGYLAVKGVRNRMAVNAPRLWHDSWIFTMVLHHFVYEDWGLVRILLETEQDVWRRSEEISNYISQRLTQACSITDRDVDTFEQFLAAGEYPFIDGWGNGHQSYDSGFAALNRALDQLDDLTRVDEDQAQFDTWAKAVLYRRGDLTLASCEVNIVAEGVGQFSAVWNDLRLFNIDRADWVDDKAPDTGSAQLEVICRQARQQDSWGRVAIVARGTTPITCTPIGLGSSIATREAARRTYVPSQVVLEDELKTRELMEDLAERTPVGRELNWYAPQVAIAVDILYRDLAMLSTTEWTSSETESETRKKGFLPIFKTAGNVRGAAILGLAASLNGGSVEFCTNVLAKHGFDFEEVMDYLEEVYQEHGHPRPPVLIRDMVFRAV